MSSLSLPALLQLSRDVDGGCRIALFAEQRDGEGYVCLLGDAPTCYGPFATGVASPFLVELDYPSSHVSGTFTVRFDPAPDGAAATVSVTGCFDTSSGIARCAAPDTPIATPTGDRAIDSLAVGDAVYSTEARGFVIARVARVVRVPAPDHRVVRVAFVGGGSVSMSAPHPTADGRTFGDLRAGDALGGRVVSSVETVAYAFPYTVDIRPDTTSGTYVAAGAVVGSTLDTFSGAACNPTGRHPWCPSRP